MMRKKCVYDFANPLILAITIILLTTQSFTALSSTVADNSPLTKLISSMDDPQMSAKDLAFFLVTHDFDATPKKDYVEVHIADIVYKLVPNGRYPGLANVTMIS